MSTQSQAPVLLAVAHEGWEAAARFAVAEARMRGTGLHLVHVGELAPGMPQAILIADVDLSGPGRQLLSEVREQVSALDPDLRVTTQFEMGSPVSTLVELGRGAAVVVTQHRDLSAWARIVLRSVSAGVAARASVPVVAVPEGWTAPEQGRVVVGVDDPATAAPVVQAGLRAARARGVGLDVVHGWVMPVGYEQVVFAAEDQERWIDEVTASLEELATRVVDGADDVDVRVRVLRAHPADALHEAAEGACLVLMGRHEPLIPVGSYLGSVARAVFRDAPCPVGLVDLHPHRGSQG